MNRRGERIRPWRIAGALLVLPGAAGVFVLGCASPGQPRPPSLRLPRVVDDLSAERTGSLTQLRWTTPSDTTDNLPVPPRITAVICRQTVGAGGSGRGSCLEIKRMPVQPGPSTFDDSLPSDLSSGPAGLLAYRVEILNPAGRSAGRSGEAFAAAGAAPAAVQGLSAEPIRGGVRLRWEPGSPEAAIELDRVVDGAATRRPQPKVRRSPILGSAKPKTEVHLSARASGEPDAGGTIDRSVARGETYRYTAQRVQTASVQGHTLELRSVVSQPVKIEVLDTFPPQPPSGLEAAPGSAEAPSIDLSWRPGSEADLAGYNVYRSESAGSGLGGATSWRRLNPVIVAVPGFADTTVRMGVGYAYRVTAVDTRGNESAPGNEVQGTPATR